MTYLGQATEERHHALKSSLNLLRPDFIRFDYVAILQSLELPSVGAALGSMYVLEGSTLGRQILSRHFMAKCNIHPKECASFRGYGQEAGSMWKQFGVERANRLKSAFPAMAEAADQTSDCLREWLCLNQSLSSVLEASLTKRIAEIAASGTTDDNPVFLGMPTVCGRSFNLVVHKRFQLVMIEMEATDQTSNLLVSQAYPVFGSSIGSLKQELSLPKLLETAAHAVHRLTNFVF